MDGMRCPTRYQPRSISLTMSPASRSPAAKTVFDMRISGTSEASTALKWPLGAPPKTAAVWRLFMKPVKIPRSMCVTRRAGVPSWSYA